METYIDNEGHEVIVFDDGSKRWLKNGEHHRDGDKPATVSRNGSKHWFKNGELHRDNDKPAIVLTDGTKYWYKNGKYHRNDDKPAIVDADGTKHWYKNGLLHRENNPAFLNKSIYPLYYLNNLDYNIRHYWIRLLLMEY